MNAFGTVWWILSANLWAFVCSNHLVMLNMKNFYGAHELHFFSFFSVFLIPAFLLVTSTTPHTRTEDIIFASLLYSVCEGSFASWLQGWGFDSHLQPVWACAKTFSPCALDVSSPSPQACIVGWLASLQQILLLLQNYFRKQSKS